MYKKIFFLILTILLLLTSWAFASESLSRNITSSCLRLHIIANSDKAEDQEIKLKVRDALIAYNEKPIGTLSDGEIIALCQKVLQENRCNAGVLVERGSFYFPRKTYENLTFPPGKYQAVRIILGEGRGQNWWCVLYPPLCFTGGTEGIMHKEGLRVLQDKVSPEAYTLLTESDTLSVKFSFKLLEVWEEVKHHFNP